MVEPTMRAGWEEADSIAQAAPRPESLLLMYDQIMELMDFRLFLTA